LRREGKSSSSRRTPGEFECRLYPVIEQNDLPFHLLDYRVKLNDDFVFPSELIVIKVATDMGERESRS
jgi:hypothetical protein